MTSRHKAAKQKEHLRALKQALGEDVIDMAALRRLACAGLVSVEVRRRAWPKLLGLHPYRDVPTYASVLTGVAPVPECRDADQVQKDVVRSLWRIVLPADLAQRRRQLSRLLNWALATDPALHYYQGLHDIAAVLLVHVGEELAGPLLLRAMNHHLREFLRERVDGVIQLLRLLPPLVRAEDPELGRYLEEAELGEQAHFALSWLLTWFAQPLDAHLDVVVRLFDFFLASHPLMPVYLSAAVVLHRRKAVLKCQCAFPEVHMLLKRVPANLPWDKLATQAMALYRKYSPTVLLRKAGVSFPAPCLLLAYPYPYMAEPQHSERYWLLSATPEEKAGTAPPGEGKVPAGALSRPRPKQGRPVASLKPLAAVRLYRSYALVVAASAVGCALMTGLGRQWLRTAMAI